VEERSGDGCGPAGFDYDFHPRETEFDCTPNLLFADKYNVLQESLNDGEGQFSR
jgi:hypothetical protein